jgi:hypothetical protein
VGAFLNGDRLTTSTTAGLIDALLVTGFPYDVHKQSADLVQLFGAFLSKARAVRRLGSAALDLCYVAAGRFDGFWEQHLKPWDVAPGCSWSKRAGGRITTFGSDACSPFEMKSWPQQPPPYARRDPASFLTPTWATARPVARVRPTSAGPACSSSPFSIPRSCRCWDQRSAHHRMVTEP